MMNYYNPNPKRVAILSVHTCPLAMLGGKKTGGMNVYVRDFSRELAKQGYLVDVFTRSQDDCIPMVVHDLGERGRVIHIPAGPEEPIPVIDVAQYLDEFVANMVDFAQAEGIHYDLIHSHYWLSGLVAGKLREVWGQQIPIVHMFHTLGHMKNRVALTEEHIAPPARLNGERFVVQEVADRLIASTPAEKSHLYWLYEAKKCQVVVIPPGVDLGRFHPMDKSKAKGIIGIPAEHRNILFAGRIEPLKGIDTLLQAISLLQHRHPYIVENVCVSIIGGDPHADTLDSEMERLQQLRTTLNIHNLVTFLGSKDQNALIHYYAAADMVVMPSHYESFGMVALEAMAMGTPVIASEVGGLAYLVRDRETGYHIPSRDPEALADRIYRLLLDADTRHKLGRQALIHAQQYDWCVIVQRMTKVYEELWQAKSRDCKDQVVTVEMSHGG